MIFIMWGIVQLTLMLLAIIFYLIKFLNGISGSVLGWITSVLNRRFFVRPNMFSFTTVSQTCGVLLGSILDPFSFLLIRFVITFMPTAFSGTGL